MNDKNRFNLEYTNAIDFIKFIVVTCQLSAGGACKYKRLPKLLKCAKYMRFGYKTGSPYENVVNK